MKFLRPRNRKLFRQIETERFILKPLTLFQAVQVTRSWRTDPEILTAFFQSPRPRSLRKWLRSRLMPNNRTRFAFAIIPKETGEPIGAEIISMSNYRSAQSAIALHNREWRGKDVVVEIRRKLIDHFFQNGDVERYFGTVEGRNAASIFNYKRLGFDHAGTWHRHKRNSETGNVVDFVYFELFRDKQTKEFSHSENANGN